jgi:hypothetical protein
MNKAIARLIQVVDQEVSSLFSQMIQVGKTTTRISSAGSGFTW